MTTYNAPLRDMRFVMHEVFNASKRWQQWPALQDTVDRDIADAILEESAKLASQVVAPINRPGDEESCQWNEGVVTTPAGYREAYQQCAEGGWVGLAGNPQYGGMGMPKVLGAQFDEMMSSASLAFILYPSLTSGATLALNAHGSDELKAFYLPKMYSGQWSGSMCLTEPHAGTDLGMIKTKAVPCDDGSYQITGTKIFITAGEHDLTENIIHLVLAKLPDAPAGTKGISLFLVPKINPNSDGTLGEANKVSCGSLEHKMGIKASATCVMNYDGAKGYLVGEANKGLAAMFTMMNYERLFVGIQGLGCGEMSYQSALAYAKDRLQGRAATGITSKDKPADPLLVHGDVRRMLMTMKALNEGGRAFSTYVAMQLDIAKYSNESEEKAQADALVALLTPVTKAFFTDAGLETCLTGQQIFGGHGYIREWGQEQLVRDVRITQIYEGTNGIQALDLLGRKVVKNGGANVERFVAEVRQSLTACQHNDLAVTLEKALDRLEALTRGVLTQSKNDPNAISSACVEYLHAFSYVAYGWMWLLMADEAKRKLQQGHQDQSFYEAKLTTARFYFQRLLPRMYALAEAVEAGSETLYGLSEGQF
ncbi:acyl-CoA dehydrogenase C-terminal domain-containing protein [Candidatus Sororendozoicomonas aggregata]|uniref:acyl-CoA dehydrogenase C-terminal domain-containing protein n=1 Tax=Candidatus Sororendozoicomonas aggregata TaxID=3073239 RepID=UPI002ED5DF9C